MTKDRVEDEYFEWLVELISGGRTCYRKLLMFLHDVEFRWSVANDGNRAEDGLSLRFRFADQYHDKRATLYLNRPCSVLEMMVALAIRCEERIMDDPDIGDRTSHWFWVMVRNLGLENMRNDTFSKIVAGDIIERFLDRNYAPNGKGGLFVIDNCRYDLRFFEIWYQMCWYLDSIL